MPLRGLGYLGVTTPDLAPWRAFATELCGLAPAAASAGTLRFRMDERSYRLAVHRGARAGLAYAGWEAADRARGDQVAARPPAPGAAGAAPGPHHPPRR